MVRCVHQGLHFSALFVVAVVVVVAVVFVCFFVSQTDEQVSICCAYLRFCSAILPLSGIASFGIKLTGKCEFRLEGFVNALVVC